MSLWTKTRDELNALVNRHFETPEYRQFFSVKLTPAREQVLDLHYPHYIKSRRDCWAAAGVKAPLDVKRAIWEHEKDELIFDPRMGSAHLTDDQMAVATAESNLLPGARAVIFAWMYLSTTRPWIEALTVNHITERKNNPAIVKGGGFTQRYAHKKWPTWGVRSRPSTSTPRCTWWLMRIIPTCPSRSMIGTSSTRQPRRPSSARRKTASPSIALIAVLWRQR